MIIGEFPEITQNLDIHFRILSHLEKELSHFESKIITGQLD